MTYGALQTRVADELARSDLTSQIKLAIQSAIAFYERQRFYFNEAVTTFPTVAAQSWYSASDLAALGTLVEIDTLKITVSSNTYVLDPVTIGEIEIDDSTPSITGDPTQFAYYRQQLRLFPTPQVVRTITMNYLARLATLSADSDTNAWVEDAEEMIRARAKADLHANVIRISPEEIPVQKSLERDAWTALKSETTGRQSSGRLSPTQF